MAEKSFGQVIEDQRLKLSLTQETVARKVGVKANYIGYLERGLRHPSQEVVEKLSATLKLNFLNLFLLANPNIRSLLGELNGEREPLDTEKSFGQVIEDQRLKLSLTQQEVAEKVGMAANYIGYLERGLRRPSQEVVEKLSATLKLDHLSLFLLANPKLRSLLEKSAPDTPDGEVEPKRETEASGPHPVDQLLDAGCFLGQTKLKQIFECLRIKKNLILQGPPGTGKTWLAKRLAFALIGDQDGSQVRAVQFHPNLSYEDFVRGYRPAGDGKLSLIDGPFLEVVNTAKDSPASIYVVVIEEINRGNPAQIFGEMLTLLEADKRTQAESLELSYRRTDDERVYIPDNVYVIGTMNVADRSLALVDLALRRRFAFIDLEPVFGKPWRDWVHNQCRIDLDILTDIEKRIQSLNDEISADTSLGPQFRIGHSYVTPPFGTPIDDGRKWFRQVVETEIGPLLDEYWFEAPDKAEQARQRLLEGF